MLVRLEGKLQTQQELSGGECGSEAKRLAPPEVTITTSLEPHRIREVVDCGWLPCPGIRQTVYCGRLEGGWDYLVYRAKVCSVEEIPTVYAELEPFRTLSPETKHLAEPHVDTAEVRTDSSVTAYVKEAIGTPASIAIDVSSRADGERNSAADENARAERDIRKGA